MTAARDATVTFTGAELDAIGQLAERVDCSPRLALEAATLAAEQALQGHDFETELVRIVVARTAARLARQRLDRLTRASARKDDPS